MTRRYAGLFLITVLHAFLFYAVSRERAAITTERPAYYSSLVMIALPRHSAPENRSNVLPSQAPLPGQFKSRTAAAVELPAPETTALPLPAPTLPALAKEDTEPRAAASAPAEDAFDPAPRLDIDNLVKQAGKADRETRPAGENRVTGPARDSITAVMTRAFTAAKLAVPLKWHEAARIEMLSPPDARKPIFQVKTAFGTYCLYYPDKLTEGTGQPRMAECPRNSGR